ncbi:MAG: O-antigen ligase family protein [Clostridia bacterium]|nr:O-antigen ligase family protein [Clostridia bacterium]
MKKEFSHGPGVIVGGLLSVCDKLAGIFRGGFIFHAVSSDAAEKKLLDESVTKKEVIDRVTGNRGIVREVRHAVAHQFEESLLMNWLGILITFLLTTPARLYGVFFVTYGGYVTLIGLIKQFLLEVSVSSSHVICGITVMLASLPLLLSGKTLAQALLHGVITRSILTKVFGIADEKLNFRRHSGALQSLAVMLGIICGVLTYFISPFYLLFIIIVPTSVALIMAYPEAGVVILLFISPFMGLMRAPSITLGAFTLVTFIGYGIKMIRGKRAFVFGHAELAVALLWLTVLMSGLSPAEESGQTALLCAGLMLIYFLTVNLIRETKWLEACFSAVVLSATVVSVMGIAEYFLGFAPNGWLDGELFPGITARATSTFDNPNILAVYLILAFPPALSGLFMKQKKRREKIFAGISSVLIVFCVILTWSRCAWIGIAVGGLLTAVVINAEYLAVVIPAAGCTAIGAWVFPETFGKRILNIFSVTDSANHYRMRTWNGVWKMLKECWLSGIGAGETAFREIYVYFAYPGIEAAPHAHSLFLQFWIQCGLPGLIILLCALLVLIRKGFSCIRKGGKDNPVSVICLACISGIAALLSAGIFDYTWYNYRVFFVFWAFAGLVSASSDIGAAERRSHAPSRLSSDDMMDALIIFDSEQE